MKPLLNSIIIIFLTGCVSLPFIDSHPKRLALAEITYTNTVDLAIRIDQEGFISPEVLALDLTTLQLEVQVELSELLGGEDRDPTPDELQALKGARMVSKAAWEASTGEISDGDRETLTRIFRDTSLGLDAAHAALSVGESPVAAQRAALEALKAAREILVNMH